MVEIVAEISASHCGDFGKAYELILAAKEAGADAVKFQCWEKDKMCLDRSYIIQSGPWARRRLVDLYSEAHTPWEWFPNLAAFCKEIGDIQWFSSVFDHESLRFLERIGCPRYKIASFELVDLDLIHACADTGKPLVMSTGMASYDDIYHAVVAAASSSFTLLHCVSSYPSKIEDANFAEFRRLARRYASVGLSDHSPGWLAPVIATALGAKMIEKHISFVDGNGLDDGFAMSPSEFADMVQAVRQTEAACTAQKEDSQAPQRKLRRSLYVAESVKAGDAVTRSNVRTARPAQGLTPDWTHKVIGMRFKTDAEPGTPLQFDMLTAP